MASLNQLTRVGARSRMRVGRGGKRGKTSGRGTKGQNARSGRKKRPEIRDIIKKLPKRRGYGKNRGRTVNARAVSLSPIAVPLSMLSRISGEVTRASLVASGVVRTKGGRLPSIKIVGSGDAPKSLKLSGIAVSAGARAAIEKAGGSIS